MLENLLLESAPKINKVSIVPSHGGCFEVVVDGRLIYSKLATGRHAQPDEIESMVRELGKNSAQVDTGGKSFKLS